MRKILLLILLIPLLEIVFVLLSGKIIGALWTIVLIVVTGILGVYLIRFEGMKAKQQLQKAMANGQPPGPAMIDGVLLFIAGVLLILPGFLSDIIGVLLALKPTRQLFKPLIYRWIKKKYSNGNVVVYKH